MRFLVYFLLVLFFPLYLFSFGFEARTLVLTPEGHVPISDIHPGSYVVSHDKYGKLTSSRVIAVSRKKVTAAMYIVCGNEIVILDEMQEMVDAQWGCWKEAWQAPAGTILKTEDNCTVVRKAGDVCGEFELYDLALEHNHIFFVTTQNIQTHNFGIDIFLAASFATLMSNWSLDMVSIGIAVAGALVTFFTDQYLRTSISLGTNGIQAECYREQGFGSHMPPDEYQHRMHQQTLDTAHYAAQQRGYNTADSYQKTDRIFNNTKQPVAEKVIEMPRYTIEQRKNSDVYPTLMITHSAGSVEILEETVCTALEKAIDKELQTIDETKIDSIFKRFGLLSPLLFENNYTQFTDTLAQKLHDHPQLPADQHNVPAHMLKGAVEGATRALTALYNHPLETMLSHAYAGPLLAWHIAKTVGKSIQIGATALVDTKQAQKEWNEYTKPLSKAYRFLQESDAATLAHTASSLTVHMVIDGLIGSRLAGLHHKIINKALSACPKPVLITMTSGGDPAIPEKIISHGVPLSSHTTLNITSEYYKRFTPKVIEESIHWTLHGNKMHHIFKDKHDFKSLEGHYTRERFSKELIVKLIESEKLPKAGEHFVKESIDVIIGNKIVEVKGFLSNNNIIKIGTCFIRTLPLKEK